MDQYRRFDEAYYHRFYENPKTRIYGPKEHSHLAQYVFSFARWNEIELGSVLDIGARSRLMTPVNHILTRRVFPERLLLAWLVHNIEEVGYLEHLLPEVIGQRPDALSSLARADATAP